MSSTEPIARLFSRKLYHFEGRIHEQIVPLDASTEPDYFDAPVYVTHVGYQGNEAYRTEKANRNLKLLLQELEAQPDDPYTLYQIGNSYFIPNSTSRQFLILNGRWNCRWTPDSAMFTVSSISTATV